MFKFYRRLSVVLTCAILSGCVIVPEENIITNLPIDSVVRRIKCDIRHAIFNQAYKPSRDGKSYPFIFLEEWAAKIHLTVAVDDMSGLNPGVAIIDPLRFSQSFSFGFGASLSAQAIKQEDIEFLISFSDMIKEKRRLTPEGYDLDCIQPSGLLLESDLGLDKIVAKALAPIDAGTLYAGRNVGPGPTPPPMSPPKLPKELEAALARVRAAALIKPFDRVASPSIRSMEAASIFTRQASDRFKSIFNLEPKNKITSEDKENAETKLSQPGDSPDPNVIKTKHLLYNITEAETAQNRTQAIINNVVKPLYGIAIDNFAKADCLPAVSKDQYEAITWSATVSLKVIDVTAANDIDVSDAALRAIADSAEHVVAATRKLAHDIKECKAKLGKPAAPAMYDPIDLISETVNFYITTGVSATPTWKLVNLSAPLNSPLLNLTKKSTNTLVLTLGRPVVENGKISASDPMNNQILASILGQALANRPLP